jgi:hypothetical protein
MRAVVAFVTVTAVGLLVALSLAAAVARPIAESLHNSGDMIEAATSRH